MTVTGNIERAPEPAIDILDYLRLQSIEAAALRVASSRRNGIVTDTAALDRLDAALEARE